MGTTKKDENKVITTEGQSQQGGQDSQSTPQKDWRANDPIAQRIAKRKELRDEIVKPLNKVDLTTPTNPLQEQGKKIDVVVKDKPDYKPIDRIPQQEDYRKQNPFQDKQSESIIPYKEEVESVEPFDFNQAYKDAKNEVDMTRSLHDAEREGEERRQNNRRIMTAIGDGLSGLANIYFTSQGTPDLLKGAPSLTGKMQERYDKMRKDAETRRANYLKVVQEGADQKVENMYTRYKDELEAKRKEREIKVKEADQKRKELQEKRLQAESEAKILLLNAKASEAEQKAIIAELYAAKTPEEVDLKLQEIRSRINKNNRGGSGGSSGGGSGRGSSGSKGPLDKEVTKTSTKNGETTTTVTTTKYNRGGNQSKNQKSKPTGRKASSVSYKRKQKNT